MATMSDQGHARDGELQMTERALAGRALAGRTIIVLGATGGLGRAVTERLRADGASVLAADAKIPADAGAGAVGPDRLSYVEVDALDEGSISAAFAAALAAAPAAAPV